MRCRTWMSALVAVALVGCSSGSQVGMLEAELRQRETMIAEQDERLAEMRQNLTASQVEIDSLREQVHAAGKASLVAEQAATLAKAEKIAFHRLLTSGLNQDELPGDERLSVLLTPLDADGELIKLPGAIELTLYDHSLPEEQQKIGQWSFTSEEAREAWHRGFTASGFLFELPWQNEPRSPQLTLHGRLTAPDGRQFDTTSKIAVRLPTGTMTTADAKRPLAQPITQTVGTAGRHLPDGEEELPVINGLPTADKFFLEDIPVMR